MPKWKIFLPAIFLIFFLFFLPPRICFAVNKVIYQINKSKDENGKELSWVKIYVDGFYIHHLDDETLKFCDICFCDRDKKVSCNFGEHEIGLKKTGYQDWSEARTISADDEPYEVNPVMKLIEPTATPSPSPTPSLTPTVTPTPTSTPIPTSTPPPSSPTPTPAKAILRINCPENESGEEIDNKNFKIYINDVYISRYAPRDLTFCSNCRCNDATDCHFGKNTIKLTNSDYQDWVKEVEVESDNDQELNPVMQLVEPTSTPIPTSTPTKSPTDTPTPAKKSTLTPTKKPTPAPTKTKKEPTLSLSATQSATISGEVLGEAKEAADSGKKNGDEKNGSKGGKSGLIAGGLIASGAILIGVVPLAPKIKEYLAKNKDV